MIGKNNYNSFIEYLKDLYKDWRQELIDISPVVFVLMLQGIPRGQTLKIFNEPSESQCAAIEAPLNEWLYFEPTTNQEPVQAYDSPYTQEEQDELLEMPCPEKETFSQTVREILSSAVNQQETRHDPSQDGDQQRLGYPVSQDDSQADPCPTPLPIEYGAVHTVAQSQQDFGFNPYADEQDIFGMMDLSIPSKTNFDTMFHDEFQTSLDPTYTGEASMHVGVEESYGGTFDSTQIHIDQPGLNS